MRWICLCLFLGSRNFSFSYYGMLIQNDDLLSPIRYDCPKDCGRYYQNKYSLKNHLKYECGVEKMFRCSDCGRAFNQKGNLKTHVITVHKKIFLENSWTGCFAITQCDVNSCFNSWLLFYVFITVFQLYFLINDENFLFWDGYLIWTYIIIFILDY